jgi:hypothetical protein
MRSGRLYRRGQLEPPTFESVSSWFRVPTPCARDFKDCYPGVDFPSVAKRGKLAGVVGGPLNPTWVEWLMSFPPLWSAMNDCDVSEMLSAQLKPSGQSSTCSTDS